MFHAQELAESRFFGSKECDSLWHPRHPRHKMSLCFDPRRSQLSRCHVLFSHSMREQQRPRQHFFGFPVKTVTGFRNSNCKPFDLSTTITTIKVPQWSVGVESKTLHVEPRVHRPAEVAKPQPKRKFIKVLLALEVPPVNSPKKNFNHYRGHGVFGAATQPNILRILRMSNLYHQHLSTTVSGGILWGYQPTLNLGFQYSRNYTYVNLWEYLGLDSQCRWV